MALNEISWRRNTWDVIGLIDVVPLGVPARSNAILGIYAKNVVIWVVIRSSMRPPTPPVFPL